MAIIESSMNNTLLAYLPIILVCTSVWENYPHFILCSSNKEKFVHCIVVMVIGIVCVCVFRFNTYEIDIGKKERKTERMVVEVIEAKLLGRSKKYWWTFYANLFHPTLIFHTSPDTLVAVHNITALSHFFFVSTYSKKSL